MELEKRKREDDGGANDKRGKAKEEDDGVEAPAPADEEVEEFYAILKRIQVAVKYFQERSGGRCTDRDLTAAPPLSLKFEREDFEGVKNGSESSERNQVAGLDLNSVPVCDVSDRAD